MAKESLHGVLTFVYVENIIMFMEGQNRTP